MNRADRMLAVLRDGRTYSRHEICERAGWLMTNNAAAELRERGFDVRHRVKDGLHTYRLLAEPESATLEEPPSELLGPGSGSASEPSQLALAIPRSAYERAAA